MWLIKYCIIVFLQTVGVAVTVDGAEAARNAAHQVVPLTDAFEQRMAKLQEQLAVNLLPKRARLQSQLSIIRGQIDEVQSGRSAVEKETLADCDAIIDRLRSLEAVRVAPLIQAASEVDSELHGIDRIKKEIEGSFVEKGHFGKTESMLRLIHNYSDLLHNVERISSRLTPALKSLDSSNCEFPREVKDRLDCLKRESKYEEALGVKDRMLWEVLQERKSLEDKLHEEQVWKLLFRVTKNPTFFKLFFPFFLCCLSFCLNEQNLCHEYSSEMNSWVELTDKLSKEVAHLRSVEAHSKDLESDFEKLIERVQVGCALAYCFCTYVTIVPSSSGRPTGAPATSLSEERIY
jgi:hypothetical protein